MPERTERYQTMPERGQSVTKVEHYSTYYSLGYGLVRLILDNW